MPAAVPPAREAPPEARALLPGGKHYLGEHPLSLQRRGGSAAAAGRLRGHGGAGDRCCGECGGYGAERRLLGALDAVAAALECRWGYCTVPRSVVGSCRCLLGSPCRPCWRVNKGRDPLLVARNSARMELSTAAVMMCDRCIHARRGAQERQPYVPHSRQWRASHRQTARGRAS